jgi:hypothetical protein
MESLIDRYPFLRIMHPAHFEYLKKGPTSTLNYLIQTLHGLDPNIRHEILRLPTLAMMLPFISDNDIIRLSERPDALFGEFEERCRDAAEVLAEGFVALAVVEGVLRALFSLSVEGRVDEAKDLHIWLAESLQRRGEGTPEVISLLVEEATDLPEKAQRSYKLYLYFCENVVRKLLEE